MEEPSVKITRTSGLIALMVVGALLYGQIYHEGTETLKIAAPEGAEEGSAI